MNIDRLLTPCSVHQLLPTNYCLCKALLCPACIDAHLAIPHPKHKLITIKLALQHYFLKIQKIKDGSQGIYESNNLRDYRSKIQRQLTSAKNHVLGRVDLFFQKLQNKIDDAIGHNSGIELNRICTEQFQTHERMLEGKRIEDMLGYNFERIDRLLNLNNDFKSVQLLTDFSALSRIQKELDNFIRMSPDSRAKFVFQQNISLRPTVQKELQITANNFFDKQGGFLAVRPDNLTLEMIRPDCSKDFLNSIVPFGEFHRITIIDGNSFVLTGGIIKGERTRQSFYINMKQKQIKRLPDITVARSSHGHCYMDGKVYLAGGSTDSGKTNSAQYFSLKDWNWFLIRNMNIAVSQCTLVPFGKNSIFRVGGRLNSSNLDNSIQRLNLLHNQWEIIPFVFGLNQSIKQIEVLQSPAFQDICRECCNSDQFITAIRLWRVQRVLTASGAVLCCQIGRSNYQNRTNRKTDCSRLFEWTMSVCVNRAAKRELQKLTRRFARLFG